jgi:hypothetical protein
VTSTRLIHIEGLHQDAGSDHIGFATPLATKAPYARRADPNEVPNKLRTYSVPCQSFVTLPNKAPHPQYKYDFNSFKSFTILARKGFK